jgi:flavin-dependent dehydrogenase
LTDTVIVVGAGPAGAVAATVLARAGVRVRLLDRAMFPRDKLCGDTVNPGTLALLSRLGMAHGLQSIGRRVDGMIVTSEDAVIESRYPGDLHGTSCLRRDLDWMLVQDAIRAGASFEPGVRVKSAILSEHRGVPRVDGVIASASINAAVTIAADGAHSTLAFGLRVAHHPRRPRRWAIGAYFEGAEPPDLRNLSSLANPSKGVFGEMHIRSNHYIGVAPIPQDLVNVCLVTESGPADRRFIRPGEFLRRAVENETLLRARFARARMVTRPTIRGPLAIDTRRAVIDGLLFAGDAAGFVDPMTGDGLRFAIRGGELAALAALDALDHGWRGASERLDRVRARDFGPKWRFNRALRALVGSPAAIRTAAVASRLAPAIIERLVARAGDCDRA